VYVVVAPVGSTWVIRLPLPSYVLVVTPPSGSVTVATWFVAVYVYVVDLLSASLLAVSRLAVS
jgi:hypothetical protein